MSPIMMVLLGLTMLGTAFLSGIFGMAGGLILIGVLPGITPFVARYLLPSNLKPNAEKLSNGLAYGAICMALVLLTGASGPLIDTYFLGGKLERREIVATKSFCQVLSHLLKLIYFGGVVENAASVDPLMMAIAIAASIAGTTAARRILEAMSDKQFRVWAMRIINSISGYYVVQGSYMLLAPVLWRLM